MPHHIPTKRRVYIMPGYLNDRLAVDHTRLRKWDAIRLGAQDGALSQGLGGTRSAGLLGIGTGIVVSVVVSATKHLGTGKRLLAMPKSMIYIPEKAAEKALWI
jgi:hypothetical protein